MENRPARVEPTEDAQAEERDNKRVAGAVGALALIIIVILILLLLPRCGGEQGSSSAGNKRIVGVPDAAAEPGMVSVWIDESRSLEAILGEAGVAAESVIDVNGGRYVIGVAKGSETTSVQRLRATAGVTDAGYVYEE